MFWRSIGRKSAPVRATTSKSIAAHALLFWLGFTLLNVLLFLPAFLLNSEGQRLLPPLSNDLAEAARQLLVWRDNLDPLRLSAEITLLTAAWVLLGPLRRGRWRRPFLLLYAAAFLLALAYNVYESLSIFFYQEDPVFYAQAQLILEGLPFVARHLSVAPWQAAAAGLGLLLGIVALRALLNLQTSLEAPGPISLAALSGLVALVLAAFLFNGHILASPKSVVSCLVCKLGRNVGDSIAGVERTRAMRAGSFDQTYDYGRYGLVKRPDIYLIFVESYGSILYRRDALRAPYLALLEELEGQLAREGWHAASALSESPTWGGGSWMAYTSALFGLRVDTHPAYLALQDRFPQGGYPHLGATLQALGYQNARVTSIAVELREEEWQRYKAFYGVDRWLQHSDIGYSGPHYGWGPAPPDQFVLNAANEQLQRSGKPLFLFLITQNSHYPWKEVPPLVDDWRALDEGTGVVPPGNLKTPQVQVELDEYLATIDYELRFLTQFILEEADREALIILVGDHQPGYITRKSEGYDTPLHFISRDAALLGRLQAYGFEEGLRLSRVEAAMKHEGLYSLLMRTLLSSYGRGDRLPPPYLPDGLPMPGLAGG